MPLSDDNSVTSSADASESRPSMSFRHVSGASAVKAAQLPTKWVTSRNTLACMCACRSVFDAMCDSSRTRGAQPLVGMAGALVYVAS